MEKQYNFKSVAMKRRWAEKTPEERSANSSMMASARWAKETSEAKAAHIKKMVDASIEKRRQNKIAYEKMMSDNLPQM